MKPILHKMGWLAAMIVGLISGAGPTVSEAVPPVAGYVWWLDAADSGSMTLSGSSVTTWSDKSSRGINLIPVTAAPTLVPAALNGLPVVNFNGVDQAFLNVAAQPFSASGPSTVFMVAQFGKPASEQDILTAGNGGRTFRQIYTDTSGIGLWSGPTTSVGNPNYTVGSNQVIGAVFNGNGVAGDSVIDIIDPVLGTNSVTGLVPSGLTDPVGIAVGCSIYSEPLYNFYSGNIAEILVYNSALTLMERQQVEDYLHSKWFGGGGASVPAITNLAATGVTSTGATLNGTLISTGGAPTTVFVYWGKTDQGTNKGLWDKVVQFSGTAAVGAYNTNVALGTPYVAYYYRYAASNFAGEVWSDPVSTFIAGSVVSSKTPPVAGYAWWLDAADQSTMVLSGGSVASWKDKTGSGIDVSQSNSGARPTLILAALNNMSVVNFDANSLQHLFNASVQPFSVSGPSTVFMVAQCGKEGIDPAIGASPCSAGTGGETFRQIYFDSNGIGVWSGGGSAGQNPNYTGGSYVVLGVVFNGDGVLGDSVIEIFGTNSVQATIPTGLLDPVAITVGCGNYENPAAAPYSGNIAEIVVYNSALSESDRVQVEAYLYTKWFLSPTSSGTIFAVR